ncbi:MAG: hypothetical protein KGL43_00480 [Burkholderiales bacterium]|nr:hypothetical protein [Burkholderiales bacterium]MDE2452043.1 hypothetical protein [Burkholderiales bacterium]
MPRHIHDGTTVPGLAAPERPHRGDRLLAGPLVLAAAPPAVDVEAPGSAATDQALKAGESGHGDFATDAPIAKLKSTLAAELALRGFTLLELADKSFLVTKWNLARPCASLADVRAFARTVGATR